MVAVVAAMALAVVTGCGSDGKAIEAEPGQGVGDGEAGSVPFFGGNDDQCPSVTLANEESDQQRLRVGTDCFFAEYEAGTPIVWDVNVLTVEGDPIYHRYAFDGETVLVVIDTRLDEFGSGGVSASICDSLARTGWLPEGVGCRSVDHPGFPEAS